MGQAIVVFEEDDILITVDSDTLEGMSETELAELIIETVTAMRNGDVESLPGDVTFGPNPTPVYKKDMN
jgi:hypothetical protein